MNAELHTRNTVTEYWFPVVLATYTDPQGKNAEVQIVFAGMTEGFFHCQLLQRDGTKKPMFIHKQNLSELKVCFTSIGQL